MDLHGISVLVTGGGSGLGEASAHTVHRAGATVVVFDLDEQKAEKVARSLGDRATWVAGDAASEEDVLRAIGTASAAAPLRGVVACAGGAGGSGRTVGRGGVPHPLDSFERSLRSNLVSSFNTVRLAAAEIGRLDPVDESGQRGAIVVTASIAGFEGQIGQVAYGSAKAGVIGMTLIAARDLSASGIRVNCIAPGLIDTPAWGPAPEEHKAAFGATVPFPKRFGRPSEFGDLAEHLLTNDYLNGTVVRLDGGIRFGPR